MRPSLSPPPTLWQVRKRPQAHMCTHAHTHTHQHSNTSLMQANKSQFCVALLSIYSECLCAKHGGLWTMFNSFILQKQRFWEHLESLKKEQGPGFYLKIIITDVFVEVLELELKVSTSTWAASNNVHCIPSGRQVREIPWRKHIAFMTSSRKVLSTNLSTLTHSQPSFTTISANGQDHILCTVHLKTS